MDEKKSDHSTSNSVTNCNENEGDDFEDGEIPDDDDDDETNNDDDVVIVNEFKNNENIEEKNINKNSIDPSEKVVDNNDVELVNDQKELTKIKKSKKKKDYPLEDDFAGNIEQAIAAALKKDGIEPPLPKLLEKRKNNYDEEKIEKNKTDLINDSGSNDEVLVSTKRRSRKKQRKRDREKAEKEEKQHKMEKSKKAKIDLMDDLVEDDDYEMLCVRGGSPPRVTSYSTGPAQKLKYYDTSSYESDSSMDYHLKRKKQNRTNRDGKRRGDGGRGGDNESSINNNGVCIPNLRGYCNNDDCQRSHDARAPRKLELCKFYLMECCAKKDKCSYMHSDFPCKYYYLGMECIYKQSCKFSHGKPLTENLRHILLKHIETAPKEILGPFKRISRDTSVNLLLKHHEKLCTEYDMENTITPAQIQQMLIIQKQNYNNNPTNNNSNNNNNNNMGIYDLQGPLSMDCGMIHSGGNQNIGSEIPSLLDMVIRPPTLDDSGEQQHGQNQQQSLRLRKSRWADSCTNNKSVSQHLLSLQKKLTALNPAPVQNINSINNSGNNIITNKFILNLRMLSNILTQEQIEKLESLGVENLEQLSQLNLLQLNQIGLTANQINEIQLNALNMEKLGMFQATASITGDAKSNSTDVESIDSEKTEIPNEVGEEDENKESTTSNETPFIVDALKATTTDVDMRFLPSNTQSSLVTKSENETVTSGSFTTTGHGSNLKINSTVDYSQYLKDSNLDYGNMERNDYSDDDEKLDNEDEEPELRIDESWGQPQDSENDTNRRDNDGDITPTPKTRDFGDDDENSSSSQDESNANSVKLPPAIYDPIKLLNNNSKKKIIDLSSTVTNMLQAEAKAAEEQFSYKAAVLQNLNQNQKKPFTSQDQDDRPTKLCDLVSNDIDEKINMNLNTFYSDFRDPRKSKPQLNQLDLQQNSKLSRQRSISPIKSPTCELPLYERASIYDGNLDNDSSNTPESPTSTSLKVDKDMRMSSFIDSVTSDIDLRLPFKSIMDNYIPATEIDGSLGSHSPIQYRVNIIDIPKATYKDIRRSIPANEKTLDPRLRRIFCLKELPKRNQIGSSGTKSSNSITKRKDSFDAPNSGQSESDSDASSPYPTFSGSSSLLFHQQKQNDILGVAVPQAQAPRLDPRRKLQEKSNQNNANSTNSKQTVETISSSKIDLRMLLQNSKWYKDLNSKHKIMVNQQFAIISTELKKFQQNTDPDKIFDLKFIMENQILQQILTNLGVYINEQGEIKQIELNEYEQAIGGINNRPPPMLDPSIPPPSTQTSMSGMEFLRGPPPIPQRFPLAQQAQSMIHMPPPISYNSVSTNPNLMQLPPDMRPGLLGIAPGIGFNHSSNFNAGQLDPQSALLMNSGPSGPSIRPGMNNDCISGGLQFDQQNFQQFQQNNNQFQQQQQRPMGRFNNFNNNARYPNRGQGGTNFNNSNSNNNFNNSNFSRNGGGN